MAYVDVATIQTTDPGDPLTAAWCDQVRDNQEFLVDPPVCAVYHSTTQAVASSTQFWLEADSELYDNDSMHSTVTNTGRITAQTAGRFLAIATVIFEANTTVPAYRSVRFRVNGGSSVETTRFPSAGVNTTMVPTGVRTFVLSAGDYVEAGCIHNAGVDLDVTLDEFLLLHLTR